MATPLSLTAQYRNEALQLAAINQAQAMRRLLPSEIIKQKAFMERAKAGLYDPNLNEGQLIMRRNAFLRAQAERSLVSSVERR